MIYNAYITSIVKRIKILVIEHLLNAVEKDRFSWMIFFESQPIYFNDDLRKKTKKSSF